MKEPTTKNNIVNPQTIPILNYQYQQGPGLALPSSNLRHMTIFENRNALQPVVVKKSINNRRV